jgi:VCBS repeat-containing protein
MARRGRGDKSPAVPTTATGHRLQDTLELTWADGTTWRVTVPLEPCRNDLTLVATDLYDAVVGDDSIAVTCTVGG